MAKKKKAAAAKWSVRLWKGKPNYCSEIDSYATLDADAFIVWMARKGVKVSKKDLKDAADAALAPQDEEKKA